MRGKGKRIAELPMMRFTLIPHGPVAPANLLPRNWPTRADLLTSRWLLTWSSHSVTICREYVSYLLLCSWHHLMIEIDCHRRLRPGAVRGVLGRNTIVGIIAAPPIIQFAEIGRNILLQHEPYSSRVVEFMGHSGRAFQSGSYVQRSPRHEE